MLGVGAGALAPPLVRVRVRAPLPVVARRLRPLFSSASGRRRSRPPTAATAYKQNQGGRRWWSDSPSSEQEEEEEYEDFFSDSRSGSFGGELFDEPWFSKVFKTYGFLLPVMLASMLVATGPRAFLMAMAIPLVQSAVSFLLDAIWGRNGRRRQTPFQEEEEYDEEEDFPEDSSDFAGGRARSSSSGRNYYGERRRPQSYQSWVSDDFAAAAAAAADKDDYSTKKSSGGAKIDGFGGWDELLDKNDGGNKAAGSSHRTRAADAAAQGPGAPLSRRRDRRGRMSNSKYKQAPLFMRLMVAVFPFLGSWFRLL
ncbi:hypothetical protein QOZ80_6BG0457570 [Eleusine coracana subsp. coracana]|nr:hypothetical protein QOZ80_6BG0457570 [Eleusine coracana subsp. coracana]